MQLIDGRPVYSATDLVGFLACEHLTNLERAALAGLVERPMRVDPELDRVVKRGFQHEQRFLDDLRAEGLSVQEIHVPEGDRGTGYRAAAEATVAAIRAGAAVIYQAAFFDGRWLGFADFLRRVETPSQLGPWSYEVWDTKLARHTKGSAVLQLSLYSELLALLQGLRPELMHVALGGSARDVDHLRVADYAAYVRTIRRQFEAFTDGATAPEYPPATRPDPVEHCEICRWRPDCEARRRETDDLSLVAGISAHQRAALRTRDVPTRTALGGLALPMAPPLEGTTAMSLARVREQSRIQVEGDAVRPLVLSERLAPSRLRDGTLEPDRGLLSLPAPSPGDLFFDIEGDPFALDDGVDYLFGVLEPGLLAPDGEPTFHAWWSIEGDDVTLDAERRAFEALIDFFMQRLEADPGLHIYHYAPYEPTAMGRLMGRYGTRELEVDRLLREGIFVDLFRAVRQGVRASVESYSIKRLEPLYGFKREVDLRDAGSSIAAFEEWLELGTEGSEAQGRDPEILERIRRYNRDDCVSNQLLRDWLEGQRVALAADLDLPTDASLPRPKPGQPPPENLAEALQRVAEVTDRLTAGIPEAVGERTPAQHASWLLGQLLSWHRREEKSGWWRFFFLMTECTDDDRVTEPDAIGGLEHVAELGPLAKSVVHRYHFPPQEHDIDVGTDVRMPDPSGADPTGVNPGEVIAVDNDAGTIDLKQGPRAGDLRPASLVPYPSFRAEAQKASLLTIGRWVADHGIVAAPEPATYAAARRLLLREPPRLGQAAGQPLAVPWELDRDAARRLIGELHGSFLAIQGPPGSGKTTLGAELIVDLVAAGKRVGVTANSHKVIGLLLDKVGQAAAKRGRPVRIGQKGPDKDVCTSSMARCLGTNAEVADALAAGELDVVGGTTWLWAREDLAASLDVLFVDEAGQMSLANVVAASPAADSLVLLGDPQQLDQPLQGSHPPGADRSALAHLLGDRQTMPPELGLFLRRTWRLHPDICAYTSEAFYEGRLEPEAGRERQVLRGTAPLDGTGIRFVGVAHAGNDNTSPEEAQAVARLVRALVDAGATWIDVEGREHPIRLEDVLIITPYNAQVRTIAAALPGADVGTVDKFQGQEKPVSIYTMATSSADDAPRGMEFLYSLNRLNVATSRARCVTAVVASPDLLRVRCRTPRQMRLANALARLVEMAGP